MQISTFHKDLIPEAANLFIRSYQKQRQATPVLPDSMEDAGLIETMLSELMDSCQGVAATENGRLLGYMGWFLVEEFRDTDRQGAYVLEWGHACVEKDNWHHYTQSPVFMPLRTGRDAAGNLEFLSRPKNNVWLAFDGDTPVGFIRYKGYDFDGAAILESEDGVTITGAYIRPAYRGRKGAVALLDAALYDTKNKTPPPLGESFICLSYA